MTTNIRFGRAKKDYPDDGIKKGQLYFAWAMWDKSDFRSLKPPRPSKLTTSEKIRPARIAREILEDILDDVYLGGWRTTTDSIVNSMMDVAARMEEVSELYADSTREMQAHFTNAYHVKKTKELVGKASTISLNIEALADELRDADEEHFFALLQKAHSLPEWELF